MSDPDPASAARELNRIRWGDTVARRAAQVVIDRADQLPDDIRQAVHDATAGGDSRDDGDR
jgi:hypothetical protein